MSIQITTNNEILIDGQATGYGLTQSAGGTVVSKGSDVLSMPAARYNMNTDSFLNPGVAGRSQFEADFRLALSQAQA